MFIIVYLHMSCLYNPIIIYIERIFQLLLLIAPPLAPLPAGHMWGPPASEWFSPVRHYGYKSRPWNPGIE